jgi:glucuronoarabinoxylan endo-1,4-beta-xylanase
MTVMKRICRVRNASAAVTLLSTFGCVLPACIRRGDPSLDVQGERATPTTVVLAPAERHQTLEGFGASIAWYIDQAADARPQGLYKTIFPDLGLDILRLRNRFHRTESGDRDMRQEVEILRRAGQALGHAPKILLSSWSPPAELKASRAERCKNNADCTLARADGQFVYDAFGQYWRDSLEQYASLGIIPDYVSIQNEPDFIPPDWEGCKFLPTETAEYPGYDRALAAVHDKVATLPSPPKLIGPEVIGVHHGKVSDYVRPLNLDLLYAVAHHLYEKGDDGVWDWRSPGPDSFVVPMKEAAVAAGAKPVFQTEFQTDDDDAIDGGFETASLIQHTLVDEGAAVFLYWNLIWKAGGGLVSVDGARMKLRDQYYALEHYARFTDPGDVRIGATTDSEDVRVAAFASSGGNRITVVILNAGAKPAAVRVDRGGFAVSHSETYRTTFRPGQSDVWADLGEAATASSVPLPSRSVATVVLTGPR